MFGQFEVSFSLVPLKHYEALLYNILYAIHKSAPYHACIYIHAVCVHVFVHGHKLGTDL